MKKGHKLRLYPHLYPHWLLGIDYIVVFLQGCYGIGVSEIVETCIRSADPLRNFFEAFIGGLRVDVSAVVVCENKIPLIFSLVAEVHSIQYLLFV